MVHGVLQILDYALLPNHLFNLGLCFDIERVGIEEGKFSLLLSLDVLLLPQHPIVDLAPSGFIVHRIGKFLILSSNLVQDTWIAKGLQPNHLSISHWPRSTSAITSRIAWSCSAGRPVCGARL